MLRAPLGQVRLLNIGELRKDQIGALTFGASIPPYKDGALPSSPKLRYAFPTAPTWQVRRCQSPQNPTHAGCIADTAAQFCQLTCLFWW